MSTEIVPSGGMKGVAPAYLAVHWGAKYGIGKFVEVKCRGYCRDGAGRAILLNPDQLPATGGAHG